MDDASQLRNRATRLFALAIQAREQVIADEIAKLAHEALAHAEQIERRRAAALNVEVRQHESPQQMHVRRR
jgi:hypothetical protein